MPRSPRCGSRARRRSLRKRQSARSLKAGRHSRRAIASPVIAKRPGVSLAALVRGGRGWHEAASEAIMAAEIEIKYDGYLAREREAAARLAELAAFVLPPDLPYLELRTLATEARQKLDRVRPGSLAQAGTSPWCDAQRPSQTSCSRQRAGVGGSPRPQGCSFT